MPSTGIRNPCPTPDMMTFVRRHHLCLSAPHHVQQLPHLAIPRLQPEDMDSTGRHPVRIVLDNIRSAHNVGSILRTADGLLIDQVVMAGFTPDGSHRGVHKAALGAQDFVPWRTAENTCDVLLAMKADGWTIAALEITDEPTLCEQLTIDLFPLVIVAGNEVSGVSPDVLALCDLALELPQYGAKQSLNVAVSAGILCYDVIRHYRALNTMPLFPAYDKRS
jgi:tRNA G18 (ribose-2'-O)-methylase SpoU